MSIIRQILYLTYFHMRSRYRKTFAGFLWVVAGPMLTFFVQSLIFKELFKFDISNYPLFLLSGLLPWFFISQTLSSTTSCLVLSREVLLAFKLKPFIIISSQVLDQFANFIAAFIIMGLFFLVPEFRDYNITRFFTFILNFVSIFYFVLILTSFLSFWHVFYRDVTFVTQFILSLIFYLTPIFYSVEVFPREYNWILNYNFFIPFIKIFQITIYKWAMADWVLSFGYTFIINLCLTFITYLSYKFKMRVFYINV